VQAEAVRIGAQRFPVLVLPARHRAQAEHLLAGARTQGEIRFHGVLAPNARLRARVVPQGSEVAEQATEAAGADECEAEQTPARPNRIGWAGLLKCL
jgi:hypothetical protein